MASENARQVAKDVIEAVKNNKRIVLGKIVEKRGYSKSTIKHPKRVTNTASYKEEIEPIVNRWKKEIERIQTELESRNLSDEKYKELVDVVDKLNKQVQLANGGETERIALIDQTPIKTMTQEQVDEYLKNKLNESTERNK